VSDLTTFKNFYSECNNRFIFTRFKKILHIKSKWNLNKASVYKKLSLLLKIQKLNPQTLQLCTMLIKMESMFKSYSNAKLSKAWVQRPSGLIK